MVTMLTAYSSAGFANDVNLSNLSYEVDGKIKGIITVRNRRHFTTNCKQRKCNIDLPHSCKNA